MSTQVQRSNAVGISPSYLPDANPGMDGGNTYTAASSEPTIQDYENIFGPSARDIKTDLQRFKRHGRWHLPDILKGPNPWLTDRIDGLITDATNSPFTTKILPYLYKEDVDGKIKWNVWSFDEGLASRVPYEAAARTLTQSKRSFAGYMVRQGMAIVLEHNFMMSPKGRENFKNQLNQLIGSIQYTNDLDVHVALVLAPSYQKTMREKYYTIDKSPSQICRDFVDLFGMMQKNANALDILIEEAKAILRTWYAPRARPLRANPDSRLRCRGGPMPDFLLCNSKLTFQMTMTPDKTNYITQGPDGVKRLKQGPDISSYRGLSVIHSRAFAMETGQQPRDVLRRRVRTAEYYRILPDKENLSREFDFYNEERDTWFTLSFKDLLKYAQLQDMSQYSGREGQEMRSRPPNSSNIRRVYQTLSDAPRPQDNASFLASSPFQQQGLGALVGRTDLDTGVTREIDDLIQELKTSTLPLQLMTEHVVVKDPHTNSWRISNIPFDLGITHIPPRSSGIWDYFQGKASGITRFKSTCFQNSYALSLSPENRLPLFALQALYQKLKNVNLCNPFVFNTVALPGTADWYQAFAFYTEIYRRRGFPMKALDQGALKKRLESDALSGLERNNDEVIKAFNQLPLAPVIPKPSDIDISSQVLNLAGASGSVNHPLAMQPTQNTAMFNALNDSLLNAWYKFCFKSCAGIGARLIILTFELLSELLKPYERNGMVRPLVSLLSDLDFPYDQTLDGNVFDFQKEIFNGNKVQKVPSPLEFTFGKHDSVMNLIRLSQRIIELSGFARPKLPYTAQEQLALFGINSWPMNFTTVSDIRHWANTSPMRETYRKCNSYLEASWGHLNISFLRQLYLDKIESPWGKPSDFDTQRFVDNFELNSRLNFRALFLVLRDRILEDPLECFAFSFVGTPKDTELMGMQAMPVMIPEFKTYTENPQTPDIRLPAISDEPLNGIYIDLDSISSPPSVVPVRAVSSIAATPRAEDIEIVVIRPNIEHQMLGIIMGLGGSELGNTLWGQTELSVYDDSMHGIWGMSYKYHERAIVFNEKNLIRLWDIAYDGYNGGKDDTYVDWTDRDAPNGYGVFQELTMDVSKSYRGPSMMVMAFAHDRSAKDNDGAPLFDQHFRRNWPSPILFYDTRKRSRQDSGQPVTLAVDYDNLQVIDVEEFRVFNQPIYDGYDEYQRLMPDFRELHQMRKTAGQSSVDSETPGDSLAFQGTMRIRKGGAMQEILGSGHHGPDYVGVASIRAGKGTKVQPQAPALYRMV